MLVPAFTGATAFRLPLHCTYDLELAAAKYIYSLPGGEVPLPFNFTGTIFYRGDDGRMQIVKVPLGLRGPLLAAGVHLARHDRPPLPQRRRGSAWTSARSTRSPRRKAGPGLPSFDATVAGLLEEGEGERARSRSWSSRSSTRATRSIPTRRARSRTPRRRRSGSSTRRRTPRASGRLRPPADGVRLVAGERAPVAPRCGSSRPPKSATRRRSAASSCRRPGRPCTFAFEGLEGRARLRVDPRGEGAAARARVRAQHH